MSARSRCSWRVALVIVLLAPAVWAEAAQTTGRTSLGMIEITAKGPIEGTIGGTWQWTGGVTVTSQGMTMTCTTLKVWPAKNGRDFDRIEATGNVKLHGTYTASDKTQWKVNGASQSASFDNKTKVGVLRGNVDLHAVSADGGDLTVQAETFTYDQKSGKFRFERSQEPVRVQFEQPPQAAAPAASTGGAAQ